MIIYVYVHMCCWWLYMLCEYILIDDGIYVVCIYVVGEYICLCAYMLLVNCFYMLLVVNFGVSMYWTMLVWIYGIHMKYVLLLSSPKFTQLLLDFISMLVLNTYVFNYAGCLCRLLWCVCCIRGDGLGDENWYHMHLELV